MDQFEVTCITKPNRNSPHEHITHIGNIAKNWRLTREEAIRRIEAKKEAYYTIDRTTGNRIYIGVARENGKVPYLRTHADGKWNDNLLAQAECGSNCQIVA
ncbi:DUF3892 domain-containing protein [Burkholderia vietnamiensis]|uniref:DUF3892 domain-containing protein n=1 Tax=Burkholderia vietnamiensis TaxID=60552 RepID=UPI0009BCFFB1|nr:DUF3892 domain-containing protein [Burkholderia vietnamiensis]HDR9159481.1 DUF3892 domain-containing protein [Burkholderia vietnamiensis]